MILPHFSLDHLLSAPSWHLLRNSSYIPSLCSTLRDTDLAQNPSINGHSCSLVTEKLAPELLSGPLLFVHLFFSSRDLMGLPSCKGGPKVNIKFSIESQVSWAGSSGLGFLARPLTSCYTLAFQWPCLVSFPPSPCLDLFNSPPSSYSLLLKVFQVCPSQRAVSTWNFMKILSFYQRGHSWLLMVILSSSPATLLTNSAGR